MFLSRLFHRVKKVLKPEPTTGRNPYRVVADVPDEKVETLPFFKVEVKKVRTTKKWEKLLDREEILFRRGQCPDCISGNEAWGLLEGPSGGLSVNYCCSNERCGSRFNDTGPFGVERNIGCLTKQGHEVR